MVECPAQHVRPGGRADSPTIAPYAFVGRKPQQDGSRSAAFAYPGTEQVTDSGIVGSGVAASDFRRVDARHSPPTSE